MYLKTNELNTHIYDYQLCQITEKDSSIVKTAISAAVAEVKSYLAGRYDVQKVFAEEGESRNPLILDLCKSIAVWRIVKLANVDMLYDRYREQYNDAISYLTKVAEGSLMLDLPASVDAEGNPQGGSLRINSNPKFTHYV